uniref:Alpha-macroglobulin receptor-binding domain-containing protein n=1 Tax=Strigamia maritima TaxID=126957 RepID=T1JMZ5_STRMM
MGLYSLIITTYALHVARSAKKDDFLKAIEKKAIAKDSKTHWDIPQDPEKPEISKSLSIEATAYACLIYLFREEFEVALPIIRWLIEQQTAQGGFESTQDTVLAIEALGHAAAKLANKPGSAIEIQVKAEDTSKSFHVDSGTAFIFQIADLPVPTKLITISATGNGVAVVQVSYTYNVIIRPPQPLAPEFSGSCKATQKEDNNRNFDLEVCVKKRKSSPANNMVAMEISMGTGSVVDKQSLPTCVASNEDNAIKKTETLQYDTKVVIYFNALTDVCVNVGATQTHMVFNIQPAVVKVYDYYEPDKCGEMRYNAPEIK